MTTIRTLEEQFEPDTVRRLRDLQRRLNLLRFSFHASGYFVVETVRCIEAGLLLAANEVATGLLELLVRELVVQVRLPKAPPASPDNFNPAFKLLVEAEDDRELSFYRMIKELQAASLFTQTEADLVLTTYRSTRNQLHHAIVARFVRERTERDYPDLLDLTSFGQHLDMHSFEEAIELWGTGELGRVVRALELVVKKFRN